MNKQQQLEGGVQEDVTTLVDKYIMEWGHKPSQMRREIETNWEMSEQEKSKAIDWLVLKYLARG